MLKIKLPQRMSQRHVMKKNMSCKKKKYDMKKPPKMPLSLFICSNFDCYTLASFQLKKVQYFVFT